jgi:hypothetical protein
MDEDKFFSSVKIRNSGDEFYCKIINVYGSVKQELKGQFLKELYRKIKNTEIPMLIGGNFNMIRYVHEKSNGSEYTIWMDIFNSFINDIALIEIIRGGSRFIWTNKQNNLIRSVLDRVFVPKEWEQKYPKVKLMTLTRVGSDHCPLLLDDGTGKDQFKRGFRFETTWLSQGGFKKNLA